MNFLPRFMKSFREGVKVTPQWPEFFFTYFLWKMGISKFVGEGRPVMTRSGEKFIVHVPEGEFLNLLEIWGERAYTKHRDISRGDVVVDIGGNIGLFSVYAARAAPDVSVYTYEPAPTTMERLRKNIDLNGLSGEIKTFPYGISREEGEKTLFFHPAGSGATTLAPYRDDLPISRENSVQVKTMTLAQIFRSNNLRKINFLKIDCEGAEYEILRTLPDEYFAKIDYIALEYHRGWEELYDLLVAKGFSCEHEVISETAKSGILWAARRND